MSWRSAEKIETDDENFETRLEKNQNVLENFPTGLENLADVVEKNQNRPNFFGKRRENFPSVAENFLTIQEKIESVQENFVTVAVKNQRVSWRSARRSNAESSASEPSSLRAISSAASASLGR